MHVHAYVCVRYVYEEQKSVYTVMLSLICKELNEEKFKNEVPTR